MNEFDGSGAERLREELSRVAGEVHDVDLTDRALRTSRRIRTRRTATTSLGAFAVVCALLIGGLNLPVDPPSKPATGATTPGTVRTHGPKGKPRNMEHEVTPPVRKVGDREVMTLTLDDGTRVTMSYPASLHLAKLGATPGAAAGPSSKGEDPATVRSIGHAVDAKGRRMQLWKSTTTGVPVWLSYGGWFVRASKNEVGEGDPIGSVDEIGKHDIRTTRDGFLVIGGPRSQRTNQELGTWDAPLPMEMSDDKQQRLLKISQVDKCSKRLQRVWSDEDGDAWQVCENGVATRISAGQGAANRQWAKQTRDGLRIESVSR